MGAIASGGTRALNWDVARQLGISSQDIAVVTSIEQRELERREHAYRGGVPFADIRGRVVILVDDGIATGASMSVAVAALRRQQPAAIVVATAVASSEASAMLRHTADEVVSVLEPRHFHSVGAWYLDFAATTDDEVRELLNRSRSPMFDGAPALTTM